MVLCCPIFTFATLFINVVKWSFMMHTVFISWLSRQGKSHQDLMDFWRTCLLTLLSRDDLYRLIIFNSFGVWITLQSQPVRVSNQHCFNEADSIACLESVSHIHRFLIIKFDYVVRLVSYRTKSWTQLTTDIIWKSVLFPIQVKFGFKSPYSYIFWFNNFLRKAILIVS